jgi:hypothetical protein
VVSGERSAGLPDIIVKWSDEEVALVLVSRITQVKRLYMHRHKINKRTSLSST